MSQVTKSQLAAWFNDPVTKAFFNSLREQIEFHKEQWVHDGHGSDKEMNIDRGLAQAFTIILANPEDNEIYGFAESEEEENA